MYVRNEVTVAGHGGHGHDMYGTVSQRHGLWVSSIAPSFIHSLIHRQFP